MKDFFIYFFSFPRPFQFNYTLRVGKQTLWLPSVIKILRVFIDPLLFYFFFSRVRWNTTRTKFPLLLLPILLHCVMKLIENKIKKWRKKEIK